MDSEKVWAVSIPLALAAILVSLFAFAVPAWTNAANVQKQEETNQRVACATSGGSWIEMYGDRLCVGSK